VLESTSSIRLRTILVVVIQVYTFDLKFSELSAIRWYVEVVIVPYSLTLEWMIYILCKGSIFISRLIWTLIHKYQVGNSISCFYHFFHEHKFYLFVSGIWNIFTTIIYDVLTTIIYDVLTASLRLPQTLSKFYLHPYN